MNGRIKLADEFSRTVQVECDKCAHPEPLRLVVLTRSCRDEECDRILNEYLLAHGWKSSDDGDVCPDCVAAADQ